MSVEPAIQALKRAPSVEMSTWYKGILISSLATERDNGGAFEFVATKMKQGTEPPPHVHEREHEMFYILEGVLDVFVGANHFRATAGSAFSCRNCTHTPSGSNRQKSTCLC